MYLFISNMCFLKLLGFIFIPLLDTLCFYHCAQTDEFFVLLKGSFSWQPEIVSYAVKHRSLCLSRCLRTNNCVAVHAKYDDGMQYNWSCTLLGKLVIGSVHRLEFGETWINKSENTLCPEEFNLSVRENCYYLETTTGLSWNNSKSKCQSLHWYSDLAELETMSEYNDLMTELSSIAVSG